MASNLGSVVLIVAVGLALLRGSPAAEAKQVALLIGNNAYHNVPALKKAVSDARTIGDALKKLGFAVYIADNLSRRAMSETFLAFDHAIEPGDTAFFFFAGHGFEIHGDNYLLPIDVPAATEGQEELVRDAAFSVERIIDRFKSRGAQISILVLDACRNNPFERQGTRAVAGSGGLAAMNPPEGVFVIFSAGAKQTALDALSNDDPNPNSIFTRNFVQELSTPGLSLVQLATRTRSAVTRLTSLVRHAQTPAYYDEIIGDVVLNAAAGDDQPGLKVAAVPPIPQPPRESAVKETLNGPLADFIRHNGGWSVSLSFPEPVTAISWRLGETGDFKETGFLNQLDPRTRKRMPNPSMELDADTPATTLFVRYIDAHGEPAGPFPIRFDPIAALEHGQRRMLELTSGSWLTFREFNGLLVYYTNLVSYRCAIRQLRVGIDSTVPDHAIGLPPCDPKEPTAIPSNAQPFLKLPPTTKSVSVELTYRDGSVSEIKTFRR